MAFGSKLYEFLEARNMSIAEAARATGLSDNTLRSIIKRDSDKIGIHVAIQIAKGFNVSIDEIQGWTSVALPKSDNEALAILEKERAELLSDISKLSANDQEQVKGLIRYLARR